MKSSLYIPVVVIVIAITAGIYFYSNPQKQSPTSGGQESSEEARLKSLPESDVKYVDLANYYRTKEQYEKAELMSKKAIELNPKNEMPYLQLGNYYRYTKRFNEAVVIIKKAMEVNPKNDWPYVQMGNVYRDQGKLDEAIPMFEKAIALNPQRSWGYKELGRVYAAQNMPDKAESMFLKAIEVDPKPAEPDTAYIDLSKLYESQGKTKEAEMILKQAQE